MKDDIRFIRLWDSYSALLTETQREITDLYFNFDLSMCEIAEEKGVSRQSVFNCLQKCRKQLEAFEKQLGFVKTLETLSSEYSAYASVVENFIREENSPSLSILEERLKGVRSSFAEQSAETGEGEIVWKTLRTEKQGE